MLKRVLALLFLFSIFANIVSAAPMNCFSNGHIGVVFINQPDGFKAESYYQCMEELEKAAKNKALFVYGNDMQRQYEMYCVENNYSPNSVPSRIQPWLMFSKLFSGEKILFIFLSNSFTYEFPTITHSHIARSVVQINAYLCDDKQVLKGFSIAKRDSHTSSGSIGPKAKNASQRGAVRKCLSALEKMLNDYISKGEK